MDHVLTSAFDRLTLDEVSSICPRRMTTALDPPIIERIRSRVLDQITAEAKRTTSESQAIPPDVSVRGRKKLTRTLLIAAVITLLAAVGVLALSLGGGRFLASLFGQENYNIIEEFILTDLVQVSDSRLNLTLESALSDGHYHFVVFSVSSLDGNSLGDRFPDVDFTFNLETPARVKPGFQLERLDTEENTDSCVYFIALIRSSQSVIRSMRMDISRMFSYDGSLNDIPASLSLEADFKPCPLAVGGEEDGVFRRIELSPFGLWVDVYAAWEQDDSLTAGLPIYDISLLFADGTQIGAQAEQFADLEYMEEIGWAGSQMPNGTHQSYLSIRFVRFLDISKVKAVVIQGQEYPISMSVS